MTFDNAADRVETHLRSSGELDPTTGFSHVARTWQSRCQPWDVGLTRLEGVGSREGWSPGCALGRVGEGLPYLNRHRVLFSHVDRDGSETHGGLLLPDQWLQKPDSPYGLGLAFSHDVASPGTLELRAFVYRVICLNGTIWSGQTAKEVLRYEASEEESIPEGVRNQLEPLLEGGAALRDALVAAQDFAVGNPMEFIRTRTRSDAFGIGLAVPRLAGAWVQGWVATRSEPRTNPNSIGALINGLTRAAQGWPAPIRARAERLAGSLVMPCVGATRDELREHWESLMPVALQRSARIVSRLFESGEREFSRLA